MQTIPTLSQLNKLSIEQQMLLLARVLVTSDLAFTYMLLTDDSRNDLVKLIRSLVADAVENNKTHNETLDITPAEQNEIEGYLQNIAVD